MKYFVELSSDEDQVCYPGQLFQLEYHTSTVNDWWHYETLVFVGNNNECHSIEMWEDKTGYVVEL